MPVSVYLLWPALYLAVGTVTQPPSSRQRSVGLLLLLLAFVGCGYPLGGEQGFFYVLFALIASAMLFMVLRTWQPVLIKALLAVSVAGGVYAIATFG